MAESESPHHARPHPVRHLLRSLLSPHSYGSVLILIAITYGLSTVATERWKRSVVLLIQVVTVWIALRVSQARRPVLRFSNGVLVIALLVAITTLFGDDGRAVSTAVFLVAAILYFIAPLSILRHIVQQSDVDQETVLGAIDAYLLVGMFFAYAYQAMGAIQAGPFFENGIDGYGRAIAVLQLHDAHDHGLRQPGPCRGSRPVLRGHGDADRPAVPGDGGGQGHQPVATRPLASGSGRWRGRRAAGYRWGKLRINVRANPVNTTARPIARSACSGS